MTINDGTIPVLTIEPALPNDGPSPVVSIAQIRLDGDPIPWYTVGSGEIRINDDSVVVLTIHIAVRM